jgi:hypothetical protein
MVPTGINEAQVTYQALLADLSLIEKHLDPLRAEKPLVQLVFSELDAKLRSLATDTEILETNLELVETMNQLRDAGLEGLGRDLAKLHTKPEHLALELDLAWNKSALEALIQENQELVSFTAEQINSLEAQYVALGDSEIHQSAIELANTLSNNWAKALKDNQKSVEAFRSLLKAGSVDLRQVLSGSAQLALSVSPAVAMPAYLVPQLVPAGFEFDVVVILDAAGASVPENLAALSRANQVVAFGDEVISQATGFEIEPRNDSNQPAVALESVLDAVKQTFGSEVLKTSYRQGGQVLGALINREFYQNRIEFEPSSDDYFGNSRVSVQVIQQGARAATNIDGANESLDAEVIRAVELVFNHALWHPEDSLLVATPSVVHAERIRASVAAGLKSRPDLQVWFESHGRERFEVATISQLRHRIADRVIFTVGYGKTPHGAVLSNFGQLSDSDGRRALANTLVSARKEIHVVSCFAAEDLESDKLTGPARYLKDLLSAGNLVEAESFDLSDDPMLLDLARRLRKLGVTVKTGFGQKLSLVASFANQAKVIAADWDLHGHTLDEKLRVRRNLLESLGWGYQRVLTFDLFSDPEHLARSIAASLGIQVERERESNFNLDVRPEADRDEIWGDSSSSNDSRLKADKPPHWG